MRILAWSMLLIGVGLAAAGAARNGVDHNAYRATLGSAALLEQSVASLDAAHAAQAAATDDVSRAAAAGALAEARARIDALRDAGTFDGSLTQAAAAARATHEATSIPDPTARIVAWWDVGGVWWLAGVLLVGVGAFMERRTVARRSTSVKPGDAGSVDFPGAIRAILAEIDAIADEIADLEMDGASIVVRERIDILQDDVITPVVEGRGQLLARHGTTRFAVYFGAFSGGERNLARVWSALTDGHSVVARESLQTSRAAFEQALAGWDTAEAG